MKLKNIIRGLIVIGIVIFAYRYQKSITNTTIPNDSGATTTMSTSACESQGGHVVFGIGPAPECDASEVSLGRVQDGDAIAIEGALCCK